jgi:hypothetical protein
VYSSGCCLLLVASSLLLLTELCTPLWCLCNEQTDKQTNEQMTKQTNEQTVVGMIVHACKLNTETTGNIALTRPKCLWWQPDTIHTESKDSLCWNVYGREVAEHKIGPQPCCVCCRPNIDSQTTIWLSEYREHLQCRHVEYHFMPNNCNKTAFKALLRAWDCDAWIDWVVFDKLNCCLVLELVSVYSPFTTHFKYYILCPLGPNTAL